MLIWINTFKVIQLFSDEPDLTFTSHNWDWKPVAYFFNLIPGIIYTKILKR